MQGHLEIETKCQTPLTATINMSKYGLTLAEGTSLFVLFYVEIGAILPGHLKINLG